MRGVVALSWRLHLQHTDPGWIDLCLGSPLISAARATEILGWQPQHTSLAALRELLEGMSEGAGLATPPLAPPGLVRASTARHA